MLAPLLMAGVHFPAHAQGLPTGSGPVVVSGVVPDEGTRQAIVARLRELYGAEQVVDHLGVGPLATPPNWAQTVQKVLTSELKSVRKGQLSIAGTSVALAGEVPSLDQSLKIERQIKSVLNPTYTIKNGLVVTESGQILIDATLKNRIVEFELGNATLTEAGRKVIDELAPVLAKFPNSRFEVIGHTDMSGVREANIELSRARAKTVKDYLVAKGTPASSIDASGVGPDRPLYANDTAENRAKNRRIEFKILP